MAMGSEPLIDKHRIPRKILDEAFQKNPEEEPVLMDFACIEALLGLPEFRVIAQVLGPKQLELHLERKENAIVCPRCQTSCSRVKESRPRCIYGVLHVPLAGIGPGRRVRPLAGVRSGLSASTPRCDRSSLGVVRAKNSLVAMASASAPCFAGPLKGAVAAAPESSAEPLASMNTQGARDIATTR